MLDTIHQYFASLANQGWLPDMFAYGFLVNALLATLMIGPLLGALGTLVVVKRLAFLSEAVGHSALTGVSIGILMGEPIDAPWISLFAFSVLFAITLQWVKGRTTVPYDALIGVFLAFALAVGAALLMFVAKQVNAHLVEQVMFGSILTADGQDIAILLVMFVLTVGVSFKYSNKAYLTALSPENCQKSARKYQSSRLCVCVVDSPDDSGGSKNHRRDSGRGAVAYSRCQRTVNGRQSQNHAYVVDYCCNQQWVSGCVIAHVPAMGCANRPCHYFVCVCMVCHRYC